MVNGRHIIGVVVEDNNNYVVLDTHAGQLRVPWSYGRLRAVNFAVSGIAWPLKSKKTKPWTLSNGDMLLLKYIGGTVGDGTSTHSYVAAWFPKAAAGQLP